jgi:hypothetical protein
MLTEQDSIGFLALPTDLNGGDCEANAAVTYLGTKSTSCNYKNIQNKCTSTSLYLNYDLFVTKNVFLKVSVIR